MLNFIAPEAWTSDALWAWYSAREAVDEAMIALEDAGTALLPLVEASQWQAKGVLALHELIIELKARTAAEVGELSSRLWEIDRLATA